MSWYYSYDDDNYGYEDTSTLSDYDAPSDAIIIEGPVRAESKRGDIGREWWGQQWVATMERLGMDGRLGRGKRYARNGSVLRLEISKGMVYAEVQGSQKSPYRVAIHLRLLNDKSWDSALEMLAEQAIYAAKLLSGQMPGDIEAVFQHVDLSLFPEKKRDIEFVCSCPDWGDPCKHSAAVYYLIAEQLDVDPFILFHMRGRQREEILQVLRGYDIDESIIEEPQVESLSVEDFWTSHEIPLIRQMPVRLPEPLSLKQLGNPPGMINNDFRDIYSITADEAQRWLGLDRAIY
jgi:uncharacterized Zn finger protein